MHNHHHPHMCEMHIQSQQQQQSPLCCFDRCVALIRDSPNKWVLSKSHHKRNNNTTTRYREPRTNTYICLYGAAILLAFRTQTAARAYASACVCNACVMCVASFNPRRSRDDDKTPHLLYIFDGTHIGARR